MSRAPYHVTLSKDTEGPRRLKMLGTLFVAGTPQRLHLTPEQVAELRAGDFTLRPAREDPDQAEQGPLGKKPSRPKPAPPPPIPEPSTDEAPAAAAAPKGD